MDDSFREGKAVELAIEVKGLAKSFKHEMVLQDVNLHLYQGKCYGFVGRNGSGKSVFFKLICGFLLPDKGTVRIFGKELGKDMDFATDTGVVIEHPGFMLDFSGFQNLNYLAAIRNVIRKEQIYQAITAVGLDPENRKKVKSYSVGMKQRLAIAQAIMEEPRILILDEPMNGLDKSGVLQIRELLKSKISEGVTILMSSHIAEDIQQLCDEVFEFDNGSLKPLQFV